MPGSLRGRTIKPMKAISGELPSGADWSYEIKWDGMRIVAFLDEDGLRLQTANLLDATASFPELAGLVEATTGFESIILDGEVVAFGDDSRPSFGRLQDRMHVKDPAEARRRSLENPVSYVVFDLLHVNGSDTMRLPLEDRRTLLEQVLEAGPHWRLTDVHIDAPAELLAIVTDRGLEGLIAKQSFSRYLEGRRSSAWRKIKPRLRQEFVVGGWTEGRNGRDGTIGSLLVGYYDDTGSLHPAGSVGSGFDVRSLAEWRRLVDEYARDDSPFAGPQPPALGRTLHWLEPELVVEVAFGEWTDDGNLRHPSYLGRRVDKDARAVVRES